MSAEHIIWDWNGTLFADGEALIDSTIDAFTHAGLGAITREAYQLHHRQPIPEFYEQLVGRRLTRVEQGLLDKSFQAAYLGRRERIELTEDAVKALETWRDANGSQSLLSMHPHDRLMPLVKKFDIGDFFVRVDGLVGTEFARKAPHLQRHLDHIGVPADRVLLVGDSVDDARAAMACGVSCVLYHAGPNALHALDHFVALGVPVVKGLLEAVSMVLDGSEQFVIATD
ncbi:HAD hydrolase-like protein [Lentzea sp. BCCO 10_0856]|uniref:HAD hydrolase-like protein n=1 Tax=Lentzea miocenica TaxID=3095431 RepID=A0ABU4SZ52_9PSEU|nr:HAD hydrolase-like protein [Lentzea sp. BCCO 10_0856]MDX8031032.1 HAD hydrolase-like protein [Lentzea sp. BCCO 10_0856]